jgi:hypothetical protein
VGADHVVLAIGNAAMYVPLMHIVVIESGPR